jgi:hypothetical protein
MGRQELKQIPRRYEATVREQAREYNATVSEDFAEEPPTLTIDDFESGDTDAYDDPDGILTAQQDVVYEGNWAGEIDNQTEATVFVISQSGLDNYPARGDGFRYYIRVDTERAGIIFGAVDSANFYGLQINVDGAAFLGKVSGGSVIGLDSVPFSYSAGTFIPIAIGFDTADDGTITVDVDDGAANLSATDTEHDATGFGVLAAAGTLGYVDSAEIIQGGN